MRTDRARTARLLAVVAIPLFTLAFDGRAAAVAADPAVLAAFDEVEQKVAALPDGALGRAQRANLGRRLRRAESLYAGGRTCRAVSALEDFLAHVQTLRAGTRTATAESIYNLARLVLDQILDARPPRCTPPGVGADPDVRLLESDNRRLVADVVFGRTRLTSMHGGEELWTRVWLPGVEMQFGEPGLPAVPFFSTLIGVPKGAAVSVRGTPSAGESVRLNLFPVQDPAAMGGPTPDDFFDDPPPDEVFADKPFTKNEAAYAATAPFPSDVCTVEPVGRFRDLEVARLRCAAARYNPGSDQLDLFRSIRLEVGFTGGEGTFLTQRSQGEFESLAPAADAVLNREAVGAFVAVAPIPRRCLGEELVILTTAALRPAADVLADYRRDHGVVTSVFEVNDGAGPKPDTPAAIRKLVTDRYDDCAIRPSYVLLFGDAEHVPTWYFPNPVHPDQVIASDYPYALYEQHVLDFGLDFAVGRLPVDPGHATLAVSNIIRYERNPPSEPGFYQQASIASQFQCCRLDHPLSDFIPQLVQGLDQRAFIQVVEDVRNRLFVKGYGVERIYTETIDPAYQGNPTPLRHASGAPLPGPLMPPFPWSGDTADISAAWNDGRFLMVHLDHGWGGGWSHPSFGQNAASSLVNGDRLPVVLSYNCSSGRFDDETDGPPNEPVESDPTPNSYVSFTERLFRNPDGGAIGVISATRTTYATGNIMIRGALDSAIPSLDPTWGPPAPHRRLGDMLNHARMYMWAHSSASGADLLRHNLLYNLFGDPTLRMWTKQPAMLPDDIMVDGSANGLVAAYEAEGATITALQHTAAGSVPVGRGVVFEGVAILPYFEPPLAGVPIELSATAEDVVSAVLTPRP